jgi:hypothetical protein
MAIIINYPDNQEHDFYQKIRMDRCFIDANGLYISTIVYKSKAEREKEKSRMSTIKYFINNYFSKIRSIEAIEDVEERKIRLDDFINKAGKIANNMDSIAYKRIGSTERIPLSQDEIKSAEEIGFLLEWYLDPTVLVREDVMFVESYKKQDFSLDSFYKSLKDNIYTDENGKLLYTDDL